MAVDPVLALTRWMQLIPIDLCVPLSSVTLRRCQAERRPVPRTCGHRIRVWRFLRRVPQIRTVATRLQSTELLFIDYTVSEQLSRETVSCVGTPRNIPFCPASACQAESQTSEAPRLDQQNTPAWESMRQRMPMLPARPDRTRASSLCWRMHHLKQRMSAR